MIKEMRASYRAELRQVEKKKAGKTKAVSRNGAAIGDRTNMEKANRIQPHSAHSPPHPQQTGPSHFVQVGCPFVLVTARNTYGADAP